MATKPSDFGEFPELSDAENQDIYGARSLGFAAFWPSYPDAKTQAANTLAGARKFLREREQQIERLGLSEYRERVEASR